MKRTGRHLNPTPAKPNEHPDPQDHFAQFNGEKVCKDRNGFWRRSHSLDKDARCVFCDEFFDVRNPFPSQ